MNYYNAIKENLINNEIYKRVKDYSKNRSDLDTYYRVGKLLSEAGKHYGEGIIKEYSEKLTNELGKKYNERTLRRFRQYSLEIEKWSPLATKLTWSHCTELLSIKNVNKVNYYIKICIDQNLSKRGLRFKIKSNEYERLDNKTIDKLIKNEESTIEDFIKNPIIINNGLNKEIISEKVLQEMIIEDITNFLKELGN